MLPNGSRLQEGDSSRRSDARGGPEEGLAHHRKQAASNGLVLCTDGGGNDLGDDLTECCHGGNRS